MHHYLLLVFCIFLANQTMLASSSGQSRRTLLSSQGCGTCHGASSSAATSLSVSQAVGNKIFVTPGQNIRLDVIVANAGRPAAGINIGVKGSATSDDNVGTIAPIEGSSLRNDFSGELTHSSPRTLSGGSATFTFQWTAPETEGSVFLRATANAVNRNGTPDAGDQWNFLEPVEIVVGSVASVPHHRTMSSAAVFPMPATGSVVVESPAATGEEFHVRVVDAQGAVVYTGSSTASSDIIQYGWPGTSSTGVPAPPGSYLILLSNERRSILGKAIIQR